MVYVGLAFGISVVALVFAVVGYICVTELRKRLDGEIDLISHLTAEISDMKIRLNYADKKFDLYQEALEDWSEAGKLARQSEQDFNEGLNNILNFQPGTTKKGDKK